MKFCGGLIVLFVKILFIWFLMVCMFLLSVNVWWCSLFLLLWVLLRLVFGRFLVCLLCFWRIMICGVWCCLCCVFVVFRWISFVLLLVMVVRVLLRLLNESCWMFCGSGVLCIRCGILLVDVLSILRELFLRRWVKFGKCWIELKCV